MSHRERTGRVGNPHSRRRWLETLRRWTVLLLGLLATAAVIELRAVTTGRWAYAELMPIVGIVGLSPLLQLPLTGVLAVTLARPWRR